MKQTFLDLRHGIVVDNFAGGGGASTGIEAALGRPIDYAINHDAEAIAMHRVNHPHTHHLNSNVWDVNPRKLTKGRRIELGWFSPDCTFHSKARGGKPFRDRDLARRRRGLAWLIPYWMKAADMDVVMLENVEEFADWGPLNKDGSINRRQRGSTFRRWISMIENLGYRVDMRELVASDYGAPTIRKRLFIIARKDGEEIVFPEATHGNGLLPYATAADIIDWSDLGNSIFERAKPLAPASSQRIARGFDRFVLNDPNPFIIGIDNKSNGARDAWPLSDQLRTITTENRFALVTPLLVTMRGTDPAHIAASARRVDQQVRTISGQGQHHALVTAFLAKNFGGNYNGPGIDLRSPTGTVTTRDHHSLVTAFLLKYYGTEQAPNLRDPLHTITTKDRFALVTVHGGPYKGVYYVADIRMRMLKPRELYLAQSFPREYVIDRGHDEDGGIIQLTKESQVRMCGNSVAPKVAEALVRANLTQALPGRMAA